MKTAIVIGATGVTGKHIVQQLLVSTHYAKVLVFSRRALGFKHEKLDVRLVNFDAIEQWQDQLQGDDLFSALGTTRKQAGSVQAQYKVDVTYQANVIKAAAENGCQRLFLVSSPSTSEKSLFHYSRMKAELEQFSQQQPYQSIVFFKPSLIMGARADNRAGEKVAGYLLKLTDKLSSQLPPLRKWQSISGEQLGAAIVACAERDTNQGVTTYTLNEIFPLIR